MYYLMFLLFVSCAITFVKAAVPQSLHEKMFHDWDKNKDGKLVEYEWPKNLKQNFIQMIMIIMAIFHSVSMLFFCQRMIMVVKKILKI